jgi:hypothetical protein
MNGAIRVVVRMALEKGYEAYCIYEEYGASLPARLRTQVQMAIIEEARMSYDGYVRVMQAD